MNDDRKVSSVEDGKFERTRTGLGAETIKWASISARSISATTTARCTTRSSRKPSPRCSTNGVAELHSRLLEQTVLRDFYDMWPHKFHNKTNGVTPRRFVVRSNPRLTSLLTRALGDGWKRDLAQLRDLERHADDAAFQESWRQVKAGNKQELAEYIRRHLGVVVDPASLFDIHAKRIHEYKRQHLNVLHIITLYNRIKQSPTSDIVPRTFIFGGKAAPSYMTAKLMIKLINAVADVVNRDADVAGRLKIVFVPNFNIKLGEHTFLLLADYASYVDCHRKVSETYQDPTQWTRMSILNVARLGKFSSDRTIAEYNRDVWHVKPVSIDLQGGD